jgi:hypothetical protein
VANATLLLPPLLVVFFCFFFFFFSVSDSLVLVNKKGLDGFFVLDPYSTVLFLFSSSSEYLFRIAGFLVTIALEYMMWSIAIFENFALYFKISGISRLDIVKTIRVLHERGYQDK